MITFAQLRTLLGVARLGSLTRAARELRTTQPTVTLQIKTLSREVDAPLVERQGRGVRLTPTGEAMQAYAQQVLDGLRALKEDVAVLRGGQAGSISVGASATVGGYLLPQILSRFRKECPKVQVFLQVDSPEHLFRDLLANELDLAFSIEVELPRGLSSEPLREEEMMIVISPQHPLARKKRVKAHELSALPLVTSLKGALFRELVESKLREAGVEPHVAFEARHPEAMKNLVQSNLGYGVLFRPSVAAEIQTGRLTPLKLTGHTLKGRIVMVYRSHKQLSALARNLAKFVRAGLEKQTPGKGV